MIVVLTGGCGFVGLNLLKALLERETTEIRILDNLSNSTRENLRQVLNEAAGGNVDSVCEDSWRVQCGNSVTQVILTESDILDTPACEKICIGADSIVHLAGQTGVPISIEQPVRDMRLNVMGTVNMLESARKAGVDRMIAASSAAVLGAGGGMHLETDRMLPLSPYGSSKGALELFCSSYYASYGLRTLAFRFANVHGPYSWRKGSVVAAFCKQGLANGTLSVNGDGRQSRDLLFAPDLAEVLADAAFGEHGEDVRFGEAVNAASGEQTSILDLAEQLQKLFHGIGVECSIVHAPSRDGDVDQSVLDPSRLRQGFPKRHMQPMRDALPQTFEWFIKELRQGISVS